MNKKLFLLTIACGLSCVFTLAKAASLEISPSKLELALKPGEITTKTLVVANPAGYAQNYQIIADDFAGQIQISPNSFTLTSGDNKTVTLTVSARQALNQPGETIKTNISVIAKALAAGQVTVAAGAKIPLQVTIAPLTAVKIHWLWPAILVLIILLLALGKKLVTRRR